MRLLPLALIIVFVFGVIGPSPVHADPGWYDINWQYRKKITINYANVTANLTDFPVMISITSDSDIGTHAQTDGDDLLFTQSDEITEIPYEIESFSSDGSTANLTVWVKVPSLSSSSNTSIYMYYGNSGISNPQEDPNNVWDSNFMMVQHLEDTSHASDNITDSTANSNNGTAINNPTLGATGKIDGAISYNSASQQYINCGDKTDLEFATGVDFTIEAWIMTSSAGVRKGIVGKRSGGVDNWAGYELEVVNTDIIRGRLRQPGGADVDTVSSSNVTDGNWHYVVFVADRDANGQIYIDGSADGSAVNISGQNGDLVNSDDFWIARDAAAGYFNGTIDEVRISSTARSADWIKTSYNNQNSPSTFLTLGSEVGAPSIPTVTTGAATNVEETTATLNGNITATGGENPDTRGFEWDTNSGAPYSTNWTEAGSFGAGAYIYNTPALTFAKGELYYYRAMAKNSAGWGYGSEQTFLTKPDNPTGLTSVSHGTDWVYLTWTNGTGSDNTTIRYQTVSYPGGPTSGSPGYFGPGTSANVTGLSSGETYYFRAWSYATEGGLEQYSDLYSSVNATTDGAAAPTVIGGKVLIINKAAVLAPWLLLAVVLSLIAVSIIRHFRKKARLRSSSEKTG